MGMHNLVEQATPATDQLHYELSPLIIPNQAFPWCHMNILNTRIPKGTTLKMLAEYANNSTLINMVDEYSLTPMHK